jgi:hypothetical protein
MDLDYLAASRSLFGADEGGGHSEAELRAAELRLGRPLPAALREHYLLFGKQRYGRAHDRLLEPSALRIERGMLFFYEENQAVFHWGLPADDPRDDPPVFQAVDDSHDDWVEDHDKVSQFFYTMLFHHRVRMQPCIHGAAPRGSLTLPPLDLAGCRRPLATWSRVGEVVVEIDDLNEDGNVRVLAGAARSAALDAFQRVAPVAWV